MPKLPSDTEIRARAEQLGLVSPGVDLDHATRRSVAKDLLDEQNRAAAAPKAPAPVTPLASVDVRLDGIGILHIDVTLTPPEEAHHG